VSVAPKEAEKPKAAPEEKAPAPAEAAAPEKAPKKERSPKAKEGKEPEKTKGKAKTGAPTKAPKFVSDNPNFRYIVRVANSDLDGTRPVALALTGVHGVGLRISETACRLAHVNPGERIGNLSEQATEGLETLLSTLPTNVPPWMVNHTTEPIGGDSPHYIGPDVDTRRRDDVNVMKMIRSYRGVRHERGQKVRGQRTRSNGRTGMAAGVLKKTAKEAAAAAAKEEAAPAPKAAPAAKKE
jgi:small subunit ribosomal protein S13